MDCLFIDLSPYYTDPIEEEFEVYLNETYYLIPSISNKKGWDKELQKKKKGRPLGSGSKILKKYIHVSPQKRIRLRDMK